MKKRMYALLLALALGSLSMTVGASETNVVQDIEVAQDVEERVADHIIMKYRTLNGHLQCRRWNATQGYWVDPHWITLT